jgi:hypothetical protein
MSATTSKSTASKSKKSGSSSSTPPLGAGLPAAVTAAYAIVKEKKRKAEEEAATKSTAKKTSAARTDSKTSPGGCGKRTTRAFMTNIRMAPAGDGDDEMGPVVAVVLSNVYDISRMLSGECDRNGVEPGAEGHDPDRMIKVNMALKYPKTRAME